MMCITTVLAVVMSFKTYPAKEYKNLKISFSNRVGDGVLQLDKKYKNELGEDFTVSKLRYYISNISVTDKQHHILTEKEGFYLIDENDPSSFKIELHQIPKGAYDSISFTIGVDSIHNCSGAQTGALDPVNGMFWTWNTGYIFFKMEGKSSVSKSPGGIYEYHIGGYKEPSNCIRTIRLPVETAARERMDNDIMRATEGDTDTSVGVKLLEINISADLQNIFVARNKISIAKYSSITDHHNATKVADNYQHIFRVSGTTSGY
ncbi:MAG: hypothetical protein JST83_01010 [Bacteroidetes bacterium]|nr:hypothetical protein [Bacteroidota bacterium]